MENVLHENNPFRETIVRQLREVLMVNQNRLGMSAHEAIFVWHLMGEKVVDGLIVPNVQEIAIKTGFNRSTFYVLAVDMQKRGLLNVVEDGKKKRVNLEPLLEMLMALMRNEVVVMDNKSDDGETQKVLSETTTKSGKIASLKEDSESLCCSEQQSSKNELSSVSNINTLKALKTTDVSSSIYMGKESNRKVRESNGKENEEEKENGEEKGNQNKEDGGKRKRRSKNGIPIASEPSAPDDLAEEDEKEECENGEVETDIESDVVNAADVKAMRTRVKTGGSNAFIEAMNNFGTKKETEYTAKDCAFYYKQEYEKTYKSTYYLSTKEVGMVTNMVKMYEEVGGVGAVVKMIKAWINDYERLPFLNGSRGDVPTIPHMVSMRHALCLWALNDGERGAMKRERVKNTPKGNELPPDALDMTGIY